MVNSDKEKESKSYWQDQTQTQLISKYKSMSGLIYLTEIDSNGANKRSHTPTWKMRLIKEQKMK